MAKNLKITKIYEVNDIFAVAGYSLFALGIFSQFQTFAVQVIPVDSLLDVFRGLFNTSATGNIVALVVGVGAVLTEKYIRYGTIGFK